MKTRDQKYNSWLFYQIPSHQVSLYCTLQMIYLSIVAFLFTVFGMEFLVVNFALQIFANDYAILRIINLQNLNQTNN